MSGTLMDELGLHTGDVRSRTSALIRERQDALAADVVVADLAARRRARRRRIWRGCAELLLRLFAASVDAGTLDTDSAAMRDLARYCPPLTTRQLLDAVHHAERVILDEVALDDRLGATSEPWAVVAHSIRRATLEILGAHAEQIAGRDVADHRPRPADDADRRRRSSSSRWRRRSSGRCATSTRSRSLLFDIDDLSQINREHGWGVGDRLLERMGILARQFFRTHDWVARHGDDAIAVLLPETTLDQAALLAARFREMVQHRLVLQDHKTDTTKIVTVSAAAVGHRSGAVGNRCRLRPGGGRSRGAARETERPQPDRARRAAADVGHDLRRRDDARSRPPREVARLIRAGHAQGRRAAAATSTSSAT